DEPSPPCPGSNVAPVYVYRHPGHPNESVSVTGGVHYDGTQFEPALRGDYFFGDYGLNVVWQAQVNAGRDGFTGAARVVSDGPGPPVDFFVGPDGALYWVAIGRGSVVRVTQDGRPGASVGACERALAGEASRWLRASATRAAACVRRGRTSCLPPRPAGTRK